MQSKLERIEACGAEIKKLSAESAKTDIQSRRYQDIQMEMAVQIRIMDNINAEKDSESPSKQQTCKNNNNT